MLFKLFTLTAIFRKTKGSINAFITFQTFYTNFAWTLTSVSIAKLLYRTAYIAIAWRTFQFDISITELILKMGNFSARSNLIRTISLTAHSSH